MESSYRNRRIFLSLMRIQTGRGGGAAKLLEKQRKKRNGKKTNGEKEKEEKVQNRGETKRSKRMGIATCVAPWKGPGDGGAKEIRILARGTKKGPSGLPPPVRPPRPYPRLAGSPRQR